MQCNEIKIFLYEAKNPEAPLPREIEDHLSNCPTCKAFRQDLIAIYHGLSSMPPPTLPEGFSFSLKRKLQDAAKNKKSPDNVDRGLVFNWKKKFAIAASFLLLLGISLIWGIPHFKSSNTIPSVAYYQFKILVKTAEPVSPAKVDIALSKDVELLPEAGLNLDTDRILRLESPLQKGQNEISLPLLVRTFPSEIETHLTVGGQSFVRKTTISSKQSPNAASAIGTSLAVAFYLPSSSLRGGQ